MYRRRSRIGKALAILGAMLYTIFAGIGCGWVMTKLIEAIG